jgi:hypothetical protein
MNVLIGLTILVLGILVLVWTRKNSSHSWASSSSISLVRGSCESQALNAYNLVIHLFLNVLGTAILAMSNYIQQISTSPNAKDILKRVSTGKEVRFGSNMPSSLFFYNQKKTLVAFWCVLVMMSLPIHLALNSATGFAVQEVHTSIYGVRAIDVDRDRSIRMLLSSGDDTLISAVPWSTIKTWGNITSLQCVQYLNERPFVLHYRNLLGIINPTSPFNNTIQYQDRDSIDSYWTTYGDPDLTVEVNESLDRRVHNQASVSVTESDLLYCYIDLVPSTCKVTIRWLPLLTVGLIVTLKGFLILMGLLYLPHFQNRVYNCLGDVISLGIAYPEVVENIQTYPLIHGKRRLFWWRSLGLMDYATLVFWWASITAVIAIGWSEIATLRGTVQLTLGDIDSRTFLDLPKGFPVVMLVANTPQVWVSIGYFLWNNQISRMWMEKEWRSYYLRARTPRVSFDAKQPGTVTKRQLQLPYWLTGIIMIASVGLHWLVSQTLTLIEAEEGNFVNFSPTAIFCVGIVSAVLVFILNIFYFIPTTSWMPLMRGSVQTVLYYCGGLQSELPEHGIAWGDISTKTLRLAGFGESVKPMIPDAIYPSEIIDDDSFSEEWDHRLDAGQRSFPDSNLILQ